MKTKNLLVLVLILILFVATIISAIPKETKIDIDLKKPRDETTQNILDKEVLESYDDTGFFVYAKDIKLGYRDGQNNKFMEIKRDGNYMFESEKILTYVFVRNPDGFFDTERVFVTLGDVQGAGNDIETKCIPDTKMKNGLSKEIKFNEVTDLWYKCEFTVETPESMYGEYWITVEATDSEDYSAIAGNMNLYYFLNPEIALSVEGDLVFESVEEGNSYLSNTLLISNDVDEGSGVPLEIFISGTNFYDSSSSEALCPISNELSISRMKFQAKYGGDESSFNSIPYGALFDISKMTPLIEDIEVTPESDVSVVFKLEVPEICNGNFDSGSIYFWARPKDESPYAQRVMVGVGITPDIETAT